MITRVAGTVGTAGSAGDDGPATVAQLHDPFGVAVTADGGFLIGDLVNNVVRKVSADGVIARVAGTIGTSGSAGDGGPATNAQLNGPVGVAATADGGVGGRLAQGLRAPANTGTPASARQGGST